MNIAGEHNDVPNAVCLYELQQTLARAGIAVPLIGIERKADTCGQSRVGNCELPDHHLLAEHVPCGRPGRGLKQLLCEPSLLLLAKELALGIVVAGDPPRNFSKNLLRRAVEVYQAQRVGIDETRNLLVAPRVARIEHVEPDEIAELEAAVDAGRRIPEQQLRIANRLPLVPGPDRSTLARLPVAFTQFGIVVFGAVEPGIVGDLVVVPYDDPGMQPVRSLQLGVGAVLRIARTVIVQCHNFFVRRGNTADARAIAEGAVAIFVDVIADVDNCVEILLAGDVTVGSEEAGGPIGAGCKGKANTVGVVWQRARAADRGRFAERDKLIVVGLARYQAVRLELDSEIALRAGELDVAGDDATHIRVGRDMAFDGDDTVVLGRDPCPENNAMVVRIAARYSVTEGLAWLEVARPRRPPFAIEAGRERWRGLAHHGSGQSHPEKISALDRHFRHPRSSNQPHYRGGVTEGWRACDEM